MCIRSEFVPVCACGQLTDSTAGLTSHEISLAAAAAQHAVQRGCGARHVMQHVPYNARFWESAIERLIE
jgi:hypothetical protein